MLTRRRRNNSTSDDPTALVPTLVQIGNGKRDGLYAPTVPNGSSGNGAWTQKSTAGPGPIQVRPSKDFLPPQSVSCMDRTHEFMAVVKSAQSRLQASR